MSGGVVRAYIALGTNLEPREEFLRSAVTSLRSVGEELRVSPVYETAPVGEVEQPEFLNAVVEMRTALIPLELLKALKVFERTIGRKERPRWHEREIDFDILFYDDLVLHSPELTIPHPEIERRAFVLAPMADINRKFVHPVLHRTIVDLLGVVDTTGVKRTNIIL